MYNYTSKIQKLNEVDFPEFQGDRIYMREFTRAKGLPEDLKRWQPTVDQMLENVQTPGSIFIMVEQTRVHQGELQRRPGLHVDMAWGHVSGWKKKTPDWKQSTWNGDTNQTIVLASNVTASRAFRGPWHGHPGPGGDCSHVDTSTLEEVMLEANHVYVGNAFYTLHEALPVPYSCFRTIVRLHADK